MAKQKDKPEPISMGDFSIASDGLSGNRVFFSMAKVINMGHGTYESMRVEYGCGRAVQDGQSFEEVREACQTDVLSGLTEMVAMVESMK